MNSYLEKQPHLPDDFANRLVTHIRKRRRRTRYLKILAVVGATLAVTVAAIGFAPAAPHGGSSETRLIATNTTKQQEQVSGWMLLGVIRECFRRNKTSRKKEEE